MATDEVFLRKPYNQCNELLPLFSLSYFRQRGYVQFTQISSLWMLGELIMHSWQTLPSPVAMQSRADAANVWITTCHVLTSSPILAVIGQDCVAVHSAATSQSLFSLDWSKAMLVVDIAEGARVCLFHDLKDALTFLSGVLLNYMADQSEPRSSAPRHFRPVRL